MSEFKLVSDYTPKGDQPEAIKKLISGLKKGHKFQTLLGVTGSGKTFTMANVIAEIGLPTLVISPNKTLAAQLFGEFRNFFPQNAVEYFISYYDYYQPEAYIPQTDTYIEKDASINEEIDRMRLSATSSLMARRDVIIVASVSCIYGLGSPEEWQEMFLFLEKGQKVQQETILEKLINIQYNRNDVNLTRGSFRPRGEAIEIYPSASQHIVRVELFEDTIEKIIHINPITRKIIEQTKKIAIYPAKHFVMPKDRMERALDAIKSELKEQLAKLYKENKLLEAQRLETRTNYDIEMIKEIGYCSGIENYSRHLSGRLAGSAPYTLLDYFPKEFLLIIDESHVAVPQIRGMYNGDRSRKETLVEHGFRLPSALDNRPLNFTEFENKIHQAVFTSATPADYEFKNSKQIVEQIIRPTGLVDPIIKIRPITNQIDDIVSQLKARIKNKERVLITTLTKKMAEELTGYLQDMGFKVNYIHSDITALDRIEIIHDLRSAKFDCLVGVNLLREGLDLPEVSLVMVLDADKEGFLRSETSLIQVAGRAARHLAGEVVMYADNMTKSINAAIRESGRRRKIQLEHNKIHHIQPQSIKRAVYEIMEHKNKSYEDLSKDIDIKKTYRSKKDQIKALTQKMLEAARKLDFEKAAIIRDYISELQKK